MRQSKFTEEQIVALLREAEKGELTLQALAKDRGITEQKAGGVVGVSFPWAGLGFGTPQSTPARILVKGQF